jgi:transcriptional regulator with XRE-family HTH domain
MNTKPLDKNINAKIKRIRLSRNITLKTLAERTGLTNGYLSRIENAQTAPPISTLRRIAEGLGIDISYFFVERAKADKESFHIVIDRQSAGAKGEFLSAFDQLGPQYHYRALFPEKQGKNLQPFIIVPDFEFGPIQRSEGEEFAYVIEGSIEFVYGEEKFTISQGDSYYFDMHIPFSGRSLGKKKAKLLVVHYPYRRS